MHRRMSALGIAACLVLALPASVAAGKATRADEHVTEAFCEAAGDGLTGFANLFVFGDEVGAELVVWMGDADPEVDPPDLVGVSTDSSGAGLDRTVTLEMFDQDGDPAGSATATFALAPDGAPIPIDERFRDGNAWFDAEGVLQPLTGTVAGSLPGGQAFSGGCQGEQRDLVVFETNPSARIRSIDNVVLDCDLSSPDGTLSLGVDVSADGGFAFGEVQLDGQPIAFIDGIGSLAGDQLSVEGALFDPFDGSPVGSIEAQATLTPTGETYRHVLPYSNGPVTITGQLLAAAGEASASIGATTGAWDLATCVGGDQHVKDQLLPMKGPKAKGKPIANDAPTGAQTLTLGQPIRQTTRTTTPEPESSTIDCLGVDIAHTAWYAVTATADGPLTVDTVGSDFDTAIAVYEAADLTTAIACADDVFSPPLLQHIEAAVTVDAEAGTTYLIQAGSFPGPGQQYGRLVLVAG
jgi:hypothetical protein